jgi:hypothetical protein
MIEKQLGLVPAKKKTTTKKKGTTTKNKEVMDPE